MSNLEKKLSFEEKFERMAKDSKKLNKILLNAIGVVGLGCAAGGYFCKTPLIKYFLYSWSALYFAGYGLAAYGYCRHKREK